jgi:hypothetical protein
MAISLTGKTLLCFRWGAHETVEQMLKLPDLSPKSGSFSILAQAIEN